MYQAPGGPLVVTRYDDVVRRAAQQRRQPRRRGPCHASTSPTRSPSGVAERRGEGAKTILNLDPPDHTRLRRLVTRRSHRAPIDRLRPRIERLVDERPRLAAGTGRDRARRRAGVPGAVPGDLANCSTCRPIAPTSCGAGARRSRSASSRAPTMDDLDSAEAAVLQLIAYLHHHHRRPTHQPGRRPAVGAAGDRGRRRPLEHRPS